MQRHWHSQPCHFLCLGCGYMVPQRVGGYRDAAKAHDPPTDRCPGCGGHDWADLRSEAAMEWLGDGEHRWRRSRWRDFADDPPWPLAVLLLITTLVWVGFVPLALVPKLLATAAAVGVSIALVVRGQHRVRRRLGRPARWRLALPRGAAAPVAQGPVRAQTAEATLRAPISGRPCLAYELALREDEELAAPARTWLLIEQAAVDLQVGDQRIAGDRVRLEIPRQMIRGRGEALAGVLRRRGLSDVARDLVVCETIVRPGEPLQVLEHADGGTTLRRVAG